MLCLGRSCSGRTPPLRIVCLRCSLCLDRDGGRRACVSFFGANNLPPPLALAAVRSHSLLRYTPLPLTRLVYHVPSFGAPFSLCAGHCTYSLLWRAPLPLSRLVYHDSSCGAPHALWTGWCTIVLSVMPLLSLYRLVYRSKQRGVLELDLLVGKWVEANIATLSDRRLTALTALLEEVCPRCTSASPSPPPCSLEEVWPETTGRGAPRGLCSPLLSYNRHATGGPHQASRL